MVDQGMPAPDLLALAEHVALGKARFVPRPPPSGRRPLPCQAVAIEDRISYMEPPWWYYPVNQSLGAALYRAGRYDEARRPSPLRWPNIPNNGWALYGLACAERRLGRPAQAAAAQAALNRAWLGRPEMAEDGAALAPRRSRR